MSWKNESERHRLSALGVKTTNNKFQYKHKPKMLKEFYIDGLKRVVKDYNKQVKQWERGLPPCRIASYNLGKYIYDYLNFDKVRVVDGYVNDCPHFWVEVKVDDEIVCLDVTELTGKHFGTKEDFIKKGYYNEYLGDETYYYNFDNPEDVDVMIKEAYRTSDDPTKCKYEVIE